VTTVPFLEAEHPVAMAHRGSSVLWPENTIYAFDQALTGLGFRYIELDVRCSSDRVPMVFHDATLQRTTSGTGGIADWPASDLVRLDAGYRHEIEGEHPFRGQGMTIPTLEELLATYPGAYLNIDLKAGGIEWEVAEVIRRSAAEHRCLIGSFHDARIHRFRRITKGRVAVSAGPRAVAAMYALSRLRLGMSRYPAFQLPHHLSALRIDQRLVAAVHGAGAQLHLWTVNEPEDMQRYLDLGVDGIISDRPDLLRQVIEGRRDG